MSQWQADAVLALLTIVTGATYFISKIVLQTVDPFDFLAIRFLSSALILYGVFYQRIHQLRWEIFLPCLRVGVFLSVGIVMMTLGLQQTTAGQTSFIISMEVVLVPIFAWLVYRQRIDKYTASGLPIAVLGLALLTLQDGLHIQAGDLWVIGSALCFSLYTIYNSRYAARYDPMVLAWVQVSMVGGVSGMGWLLLGGSTMAMSTEAVYGIVFLVLIATVMRFCVQTYAQKFTTATHTSLIFMLEPVVAALFGYWMLDEVLSQQAMWGCLLIMLATCIAKCGYYTRIKA